MSDLLPCSTCPWRMDKGARDIPLYNHTKACALVNTTGATDGFRRIMACHGSSEDEPRACNGYLAREGARNLNVRILAATGKAANPWRVAEACRRAKIRLHRTYTAVLAKLARTRSDRAESGI